MQHQVAVEESHRLSSEKSLLIDTVKKLNRDVAKLEAFKKNLLQTLQDDDEVRMHAGRGAHYGEAHMPMQQLTWCYRLGRRIATHIRVVFKARHD